MVGRGGEGQINDVRASVCIHDSCTLWRVHDVISQTACTYVDTESTTSTPFSVFPLFFFLLLDWHIIILINIGV